MKPRHSIIASASILLLSVAHAAEFTWSGSSGGTWNSTNTNWSGAPADPWNSTNGPGNVARFNSNGHNVSVSGDVFTNGINFAQSANIGGSGTINFVGSSPTVNVPNGGNINAKLAGTDGFTKTGNNTLTLRGDNSGLSGTIFHTQNRLSAGASNAVGGTEFGSGTVDVSSGAFIRFFQVTNAATQEMTANLVLRGTGNGQGALQNDGSASFNHMIWGGTITLAENARIDSQNSGRYTFNGDIGQTGGTHTLALTLGGGPNAINAGLTMGTVNHSGNGAVNFGADSVIDVGTWSSSAGTGAVNFGTASVNALGTLTTNRNTNLGKENQLTGSTAVTIQGGTFNLGGFNQQAGAFTQTGGTVSNGTLNASSFALNGGTFAAVPDGSGTISFGGGTLQQSDATDHSSRFSTAAGQQFRIDVSGAANTVPWATGLTSTDSTLAKFGSGTLVLAADNSGLSGALSFGGNGVNAGHIRLSDSAALGGITNVNLGGTQSGGVSGIQLESGVSISQSITTLGRQNPATTGYILRNISGDNSWNGNITINGGGGSYGFVSDAGTLTIGGDVESTWVSTFGPRAVSFAGDGDFLVTGDLLGGGPNSQNLNITMNGAGTLTLSGSNTYTGPTMVSAGTLLITGALGATNVTVDSTATIGGSGSLAGNLTFASGANFLFDPTVTLTATAGTVSFADFGIANLIGLDGSVAVDTYTLIQDTGTAMIDFSNVSDIGLANAVPIGDGKSAYFQQGSLQLVVIPEPSVVLLGGLAILTLLRRRRGG